MPDAPTLAPPKPVAAPPFLLSAVRKCDGRRALLATADIPSGTLLIREVPCLVADNAHGLSSLRKAYDDWKSSSKHDQVVAALPSEAYTPTRQAPAHSTMENFSRVQCSVLSFGPDRKSDSVSALFPTISWLGHSCAPNATTHIPTRYRIDNRLILSIIATEDISAGTEITISYVDLLQRPTDRKAQLTAALGSACTCTVCKSGSIGRESATVAAAGTEGPAGSDSSSVSDSRGRLGLDAALVSRAAGASEAAAAGLPAAYNTAMGCKDLIERARKLEGFLSDAQAVLAGTHWRMIHARHALILCYGGQKRYADAWKQLEKQVNAIYSILPASHADAQRLTMDIGGEILRAWMRVDKMAALEASAGSLLRSKSMPSTGTDSGAGAGAAAAAPVSNRDAADWGPDAALSSSALPTAAGSLGAAIASQARGIDGISPIPWVRDMVRGNEVLRPYVEQGFVTQH